MTPDDFKVTDDHRDYCLERGWPLKLADVFLPRFVNWWRDILEDGRKPKWKSADLAFKKWIRNSSPLTAYPQFYSARQWETDLEAAKRLENPPRTRTPVPYHPKEMVPDVPLRTMGEMGLNILRNYRKQVGI